MAGLYGVTEAEKRNGKNGGDDGMRAYLERGSESDGFCSYRMAFHSSSCRELVDNIQSVLLKTYLQNDYQIERMQGQLNLVKKCEKTDEVDHDGYEERRSRGDVNGL